jgi:hypothetical protein
MVTGQAESDDGTVGADLLVTGQPTTQNTHAIRRTRFDQWTRRYKPRLEYILLPSSNSA